MGRSAVRRRRRTRLFVQGDPDQARLRLAPGPIYRVGLALLDLDDPRKVLRRTDEWVLGPAAPYERSGDVNKVVFPTGWVLDPATGVLSLYYGAGDSAIALVTAKLEDVLALMRTLPAG